MAFLAASVNKTAMILQRNFLQLQQLNLSNQVIANKNEMEDLKAQYRGVKDSSGQDIDVTEMVEYQQLEREDEMLETEKEYLDNELQMLNDMISSADNILKKGMEASCKVQLS